jgi:hypothetical protein
VSLRASSLSEANRIPAAMSLSAISLYTSPPGAVYSSEFDPSSRGSSPCTTAAPPPPAASHRLPAGGGGLSCLFSSPAAAAAPPRTPAHDELGVLWHDRSDDLSVGGAGSCSYSHSSSPPPPPPQPRVGVSGAILLVAVPEPTGFLARWSRPRPPLRWLRAQRARLLR